MSDVDKGLSESLKIANDLFAISIKDLNSKDIFKSVEISDPVSFDKAVNLIAKSLADKRSVSLKSYEEALEFTYSFFGSDKSCLPPTRKIFVEKDISMFVRSKIGNKLVENKDISDDDKDMFISIMSGYDEFLKSSTPVDKIKRKRKSSPNTDTKSDLKLK